MAQCLLILALVLTVVLAFNFFTIKAFKLPDAKRKKYRQIALVVYGFLILSIGFMCFMVLVFRRLVGWNTATKKTHNSFRSRATGAPIISRYLATVRLAIG